MYTCTMRFCCVKSITIWDNIKEKLACDFIDLVIMLLLRNIWIYSILVPIHQTSPNSSAFFSIHIDSSPVIICRNVFFFFTKNRYTTLFKSLSFFHRNICLSLFFFSLGVASRQIWHGRYKEKKTTYFCLQWLEGKIKVIPSIDIYKELVGSKWNWGLGEKGKEVETSKCK